MIKHSFRRGGFTMMELIIGIIIVAILACIALPMYQRAIERMRIADAIMLMGTELASQERYALTKHHYTKQWAALDAAPVEVRAHIRSGGTGPGYLSADGTIFYTRGGANVSNSERKAGFAVDFQEFSGNRWYMVAERVGEGAGGYQYTLVRPFDVNQTVCVPNPEHEESQRVCVDFMGVETPSQLPPDPRPFL